jgi:branched-chain amino acid transport system permease protein
LGVVLLIGFDNVVAPVLDGLIQDANINPSGNPLLTFSNWKLMIFGLALIFMMRFRPEGLLPSRTVEAELVVAGRRHGMPSGAR